MAMIYNYNSLNAKDLDFLKRCRSAKASGLPGWNRFWLVMERLLRIRKRCFRRNYSFKNAKNAISYADIPICKDSFLTGKENHKRGSGRSSVEVPEKTQYMILTSDGKDWKPEFLSLEYDVDTVIKEIHESGLWDASPYWCRITEHLLDTGELPHGTVLNHVMKLNDYQDLWYNIADSYWEKALDELGIR